MSLLDFHGKNLLPTVWSPDGDLMMRFRAQMGDQIDHRFLAARDVILVGDSVSHYWQWDSDIDILLPTPEQDIGEARQHAKRVNGFPLVETDNKVFFWPIRDDLAPEVLAKHFGAVYSVPTGTWYGQHVQDEMEMQRSAGVLHHANWRLYKAKHDDDPYPYDWRVLAEAFGRLDDNDRSYCIDEIRYRAAQIDRNVTKLLKRQPRDIWKAAEAFDQELAETEEVPAGDHVPRRVALALLHRFRYQDLLSTMIDIDDRLHRQNRFAAAAEEPPERASAIALRRRMQQFSDLLLQQHGGSARAVEEMYRQFRDILDNSRYILTDMRRRRIVYQLYRDYYLGQRNR